ncbi:phage tail protein [Amycolatopsis sp. AA4]|uniref:phage tail protein n=1 Tax=Actinomycetes TaxID=1760 RepID=UPI0001B57A0A|nr:MULTISPECIES: phage tail protein [Actinomycetes]ATY09815.1 phage tail protein [Amycolatopsis sp. AA4]EFL05216.1 phage tail protein [Streptomyces sp. AA4]
MSDSKTKRRDPYKNFRFRVKFSGGDYLLGVSKITGFKRSTEVIKHRSGGDPATSAKLPGRTEYDAITLERGVTADKVFAQWANRVWSFANSGQGLETSLKDFRRDLIVDVFDEGGQKVLSYQVFNCWVSEWQPVSDLDANANAVAVQHIKVENEGWVAEEVAEPQETSFEDPA